jgi:galactose mutarotase-like enzyme
MKSKIYNDQLTIEIKHHGAELSSIKNNNGIEFMWQAEPVWPRHAPILFPIVGRLKNDIHSIAGKDYTLTQHGFARDKTFEPISSTTNEITFLLRADEDTLKKFPFQFELYITYTLIECIVKVSYKVINKSEAVMPFSIGAHPGFCCPINLDEQLEDYEIVFSDNELLETALLQNGLFSGEKEIIQTNANTISLTKNTFDKDALVFEKLKSKYVSLYSKISGAYVKVSLDGFPFLGIWAKPAAPFVCIEPWCGLADASNADGNLFEKKGINFLAPNANFERSYTIEVYDGR